jgi:deoxyribonucleoside regulator
VQVGKVMNISQSEVSRVLTLARARGLVRITVPDYEPRDAGLERRLKTELGVDAVVIRAAAGLRIQDLRHTLGYFAASVVSGWLKSRQVIAVAGGRTMRLLVDRPGRTHNRLPTIQATLMLNTEFVAPYRWLAGVLAGWMGIMARCFSW